MTGVRKRITVDLLRRPARALLGTVTAVLLAATIAACSREGQEPPPAAGATGSPVVPVVSPTAVPATPPGPTIDLAAIDPCELVTKAEAEAILGLGVDDPHRNDLPETRSCTYYAPPTGPVGKVDVFVGQGAENVLNFNRDLLNHDFTEVADVADEAYEKPYEFYFRKADVWVVIAVVRIVPAEEIQDRLEKAARTAATRV